jgi:hypothetical protein
MGSSRSEYGRDTINWLDLQGVANEMAWKKSGFVDSNALKDHVRSLPLEDRLDLLTEYFIDDISKVYLGRKQAFLENLGQSVCVTKDEVLEYAARVYPSFEVDTAWMEDHYISPRDLRLTPRRQKR